MAELFAWGEYVEVGLDKIHPIITTDPDDDFVLACALEGEATCIVTYDPHFDVLGGAYKGIPILDGLRFLYLVRGDTAPGKRKAASAPGASSPGREEKPPGEGEEQDRAV